MPFQHAAMNRKRDVANAQKMRTSSCGGIPLLLRPSSSVSPYPSFRSSGCKGTPCLVIPSSSIARYLPLSLSSLGMSWPRHVNCATDDLSVRTNSREQSAALPDPTVFMVPHQERTTLQTATDNVFVGNTCLDFSHPGPGICPYHGVIPSDACFWNFRPFSALNARDRLFTSFSAVAVDAAVGLPPTASESELGVEYTLFSVVYDTLEVTHHLTQFRLNGLWLKYDCGDGVGTTATSASFHRQWHSGRQVLDVYVEIGLLVEAGSGTGVIGDASPNDGACLSYGCLRAPANIKCRDSD